MSTIYIVAGSTGEYSDRTDWNVCAFTSEAAAQERIRKLDELMQQLDVGNYNKHQAAVDAMKAHTDGDPYFQIFYTSTSYSYSACELVQP